MKIQELKGVSTAVFFFMTLSGFVIMFLMLTNGPGASTDSLGYFQMSDDVIGGEKFLSLDIHNTHFPPGYPLGLSLVRKLNPDVYDAGRIYHSLLFAVNIALIGIFTNRLTGKNLLAAALSMGLFLLSNTNLTLHAMAFSEPQYITFSLLTLILTAQYLTHPKPLTLIGAALSAGAAMLSRYVGITLLAPLVVGFLFLGNRTRKEEIKDALLASFIAVLPLGAWLIRNIIVADSATNRSLLYHPMGSGQFRSLFTTIYTFLFPVDIEWWSMAAVAVILIIVFFVIFNGFARKSTVLQQQTDQPVYLTLISALYGVVYILFLFFSISFIDASTPLNMRLLLPILWVLALAILGMVWFFSKRDNNPTLWWGFMVLLLLSLSMHYPQALDAALKMRWEGSGFTSPYWKYDSPSIKYIRALDEDQIMYSNFSEAVTFLTNRPSGNLPVKYNTVSTISNPDYVEDLQHLCEEIQLNQAVVVYFYNTYRVYLAQSEDILSACGASVWEEFEDGLVLGSRD